jgi:hypothetical protein
MTRSTRAFPESIRALLEAHHAGGVSEADCLRCHAACCLEPGFAILENVIEIHACYRRGGLHLPGAFHHEHGLSLAELAYRTFDLTVYRAGRGARRRELLLFHPRVRSAAGELVAIPELEGVDYWEARARLFAANPWLSRGCVFLDRRAPRAGTARGAPRRCLLHERGSATRLGRKPIDCVFFTCERRLLARLPDEALTVRWLDALAEAYPGSLERFRALADPR